MSRQQTVPEEIANSATHAIGAALSVAALAILVTLASLHGDAWRIVSFSIYGATLFMLYLASSLYHGFQEPQVKKFFRILDHAAIFLLIAGTYTPFTLVSLRGPWGWTLFAVIWTLAVMGIVHTIFFIDRFRLLSVFLYIGMGWLVIVAAKPMMEALSTAGLAWMAAGGLAYTLGVVFYAMKKVPYAHAVWHLFVLGGSACHFFGILFHVLPMESVA